MLEELTNRAERADKKALKPCEKEGSRTRWVGPEDTSAKGGTGGWPSGPGTHTERCRGQ